MGDGAGARWINALLVFIVAFIGLHVLFVLFDANAGNGIVQFVNSIARLFLAPFTGIFDSESPRTRRLVAALIAVVVYALLAGIAIAVNRSVRKAIANRNGEPPPGSPADVDTTRRV